MSLQMRMVAGYLHLTMKRSMSTVARAQQTIAAPKTPTPPPPALRARHSVTSRQVGGFTCHTVAPHHCIAERSLIYLHGGAYISGMSPQHWALVSRLVNAGIRVEVPDYGLAPQHTHRDAYPLVTAVHDQLLADANTSTITIAGDSAGGGLALGFAQSLLEAGRPQPHRLVLIAPWLDLALTNPALPAAEARYPWLSSVGLVEAGKAWAGGDDPSGYRLSPVNGPLTGLGPTNVLVGTRDLFHPDVLLLRDRAVAQGSAVDVTVCEGAVHVYPLLPVPEGRAATTAIVEMVTR